MLHFYSTKEAYIAADDEQFATRGRERAEVRLEAFTIYLRDRTMCSECGETSARDFRFCPWCAYAKQDASNLGSAGAYAKAEGKRL